MVLMLKVLSPLILPAPAAATQRMPAQPEPFPLMGPDGAQTQQQRSATADRSGLAMVGHADS